MDDMKSTPQRTIYMLQPLFRRVLLVQLLVVKGGEEYAPGLQFLPGIADVSRTVPVLNTTIYEDGYCCNNFVTRKHAGFVIEGRHHVDIELLDQCLSFHSAADPTFLMMTPFWMPLSHSIGASTVAGWRQSPSCHLGFCVPSWQLQSLYCTPNSYIVGWIFILFDLNESFDHINTYGVRTGLIGTGFLPRFGELKIPVNDQISSFWERKPFLGNIIITIIAHHHGASATKSSKNEQRH
jgi:hypothetical protein